MLLVMMACPLNTMLDDLNNSPSRKRKRSKSAEPHDDDVDTVRNTARKLIARPNPPRLEPRDEDECIRKGQTRRTSNGVCIQLSMPARSLSPACRMESEHRSHELEFRGFSIFEALLNHAELVFEFSKHLDIDDLVSLYSISKEFHNLVNKRFTHMIRLQSTRKAPESSRIFVFRCYQSLCQRDPANRPLERLPKKVRWVPTFRWLRMIFFREKIVSDIIECLGDEGHFMPRRVSLTIKKIWFTVDIGDNVHRTGTIRNRRFWTDEDLYLATLFFIKLDLCFTHPVTGTGEVGLRKMLLGQRSLSTLLLVLKRRQLLNQSELMCMLVKWDFHLTEQQREEKRALWGVPQYKAGGLSLEGWVVTGQKLNQVDELVMREAIKRRLHIHENYMDMILYGYVHKSTFEDVWHAQEPCASTPGEDQSENADNGDGVSMILLRNRV